MTYEELVTAYGHSIGIFDIEVAAEGAVFEIDECAVIVRPDTPSERINLMVQIGVLDGPRRGETAAKLLQLNFLTMLNGGLSVAADEDTGQYYALVSLPLQAMDAARFEQELATMVAKAKAAQELISTEAESAQARAAREQEQAASASDTYIRI